MNLVLAIVEPILVLVVVGYWLTASATMHRILFWSFILQLLICAGFGLLILLFVAHLASAADVMLSASPALRRQFLSHGFAD